MTTIRMKGLAAFSLLALAAAPALACEDHGDAGDASGVYGSATAPMDPAPQAQTPREGPNARAYRDIFPDIGFGKWWIGD